MTYHSALLKGYSNGANGKVGFCYSNTITDPTPDNSMCVVTSLINADNSYTITVDELKVNTTYYYRAFATKDNMVVLAKEVKTFKTKEIIFEAVDLGLPSGMKWANLLLFETCGRGQLRLPLQW